jgi:glycosyltransferase involved in cell wall biosynthesis
MFASLVGSVPLSMEVHTPATAEGNPALLRLKLERAALVTAISEYAADLVRRIAPGALVHVVHCGLDPLGSDDSGDQADPGGAFDVVAVGSLVEKKGHVHLIQASALLCERLPHTVAIVGDGPLRKELEAAIHATGAPVRLLGELPPDETRNVLRATRVCALACVRTDAGDEDGIPVALMEAMQLGVPVVSTCVSGIPELLDGGRAGALVDPGDPVALASALEMALTDEGWRDHAASLAADRIADGFDNRTETLRLVELLAAVARRGYSGEGTGWHG